MVGVIFVRGNFGGRIEFERGCQLRSYRLVDLAEGPLGDFSGFVVDNGAGGDLKGGNPHLFGEGNGHGHIFDEGISHVTCT